MEEIETKKYGKSKEGNFWVKDSIGVPHPYCITPKHVAVASDEFSEMLGKEAIKQAEEKGACCDICRRAVYERKQEKILTYDEHGQALLIACKKDAKRDKKAEKELHTYLLKIKDKAEKKGFVGFAFMKV